MNTAAPAPLLEAVDLAVQAGGKVLQRGVAFALQPGEVLALVGPSGSGKSTLLRHLLGLTPPAAGQVRFAGSDMHSGDEAARAALRRHMGVTFQQGALWSSMGVGENVMLPLQLFTPLTAAQRRARAEALLAQVGLVGAFERAPAALSGGMRKRAALARALALEPELLLLDEPSSGLDPLAARQLDALILRLRDTLGTGIVLVSHDVASILAVADRALYLDPITRTMLALAPPRELLQHGPAAVQVFLRNGQEAAA